MSDNPHKDRLLGLILHTRMKIVERIDIPVHVGEPSRQKHDELMALYREAHMYVAELEKIVGGEETERQWKLLGRVAYNLTT
ncbi:MAG: hypothetical protein ACJ788_12790 [Ktedonobacteraceae bacterium]|jgi:hypothetical protein